MDIIHEPVTGYHDRIARVQLDFAPHIDAHVRAAEKIGHEVTLLVMKRFTLIQKAGLNGKSGR